MLNLNMVVNSDGEIMPQHTSKRALKVLCFNYLTTICLTFMARLKFGLCLLLLLLLLLLAVVVFAIDRRRLKLRLGSLLLFLFGQGLLTGMGETP